MAEYRVIKHKEGENVVPVSRNIVLSRSTWKDESSSYTMAIEGISFMYGLTEDEYWKLRAELVDAK